MRTDCTILSLSCISSVKCSPKWSRYFHGNIRWHLGYTRSASIIGSSLACKWLTCSLFRGAYRAIMYNTSGSLWPTLPQPLCPYSASAVLPSLWPDPLAPASPQASHHHRAPSLPPRRLFWPRSLLFPSHLCHSWCFTLLEFLCVTHPTSESKFLCFLTFNVTQFSSCSKPGPQNPPHASVSPPTPSQGPGGSVPLLPCSSLLLPVLPLPDRQLILHRCSTASLSPLLPSYSQTSGLLCHLSQNLPHHSEYNLSNTWFFPRFPCLVHPGSARFPSCQAWSLFCSGLWNTPC